MWNIGLEAMAFMSQPLQNFEGRYHEKLAMKVIGNKELVNEVLDKEKCKKKEIGTRYSNVAL